MGKFSGKSCRIVTMLALTMSFLVVEIIVGHIANSLALLADAFHMLSDTMALVVGLAAVQLARRGSSKNNTYGWARAEVVGALINAVFLVALCFTILVEALERLIMREAIEDAFLLLYVGGAGLVINLVGLFLFHDHAHGHTHGGISHGHSHGPEHTHSHTHSHSHSHSRHEDQANGHSHLISNNSAKLNGGDSKVSDLSHSSDSDSEDTQISIEQNGELLESQTSTNKERVRSHQMNMRGVFLHMLGDALGSVVVMLSAGLTIIARTYIYPCPDTLPHLNSTNTSMISAEECMVTDPDWVLCIDPTLSLILVAIILFTALPLLKQTAVVLMQSVPAHLPVPELKDYIEQITEVENVHEFHVWGLTGNKVVASLHIHTSSLETYISAANDIKQYLHMQGIHSVTIQPEFTTMQTIKEGRQCTLECGPDMECFSDTCCGRNNQMAENRDQSTQLRKRSNSSANAMEAA